MKSKAFLKIKDILNEFAKSLNDSNSTKSQEEIIEDFAREIESKDLKLQSMMAQQIGFYYWEYDIKNNTMHAPYQHLAFPNMPNYLENYPKSFLKGDYIHTTSVIYI